MGDRRIANGLVPEGSSRARRGPGLTLLIRRRRDADKQPEVIFMRLPVLLVLGLVIGAAAAGCAHFWPKDASAATSADQRFDGKNPVIVRVVGRNKVLTISSGARGVAYSVNGSDGRALLSH